MRNRLLFCVMITMLAMFSALFARYGVEKRNGGDTIPVMAYSNKSEDGAGITFTDLAQKVSSIVNGEEC